MPTDYNFQHLNDVANLINLKISHVFYCTLDTSWHFDNHSNDYNRLYFVKNGHGYMYNDKERVDLFPGRIYLIPANSTYNYRCDSFLEKFFIHFKINILPTRDILSRLDKIVEIVPSQEEFQKIEKMFYDSTIESALFFRQFIESIALSNISAYINDIERDIHIYKKYLNLYKYIDSNLSAKLTVREVAKAVGFSQTYLGQQFKADTNQTIKSYITGLLVDRMKRDLLSGIPLSTISDSMQFNYLSYCSKFFTKHMKITPREYIKNHISH